MPQSVTAAKKRQQVPSGWVEAIAEKFNISSDWLFFGRGPMRPGETPPHATIAPQEATPAADEATPSPENRCPHCVTLKSELDEERRERRAMTGELRELTAENRQLWKDNGELREKCARLEERQYQRTASHGDSEAVGNAG